MISWLTVVVLISLALLSFRLYLSRQQCSKRKLSRQVLSTQTTQHPAVTAWIGLVRAQATTVRRFNAQLEADHGLTINDYEVLLHLSHAEDRRLRRIDLAERVLLTPSGITRLLEGLERSGYVERASCASDARVTYAQLTDDGHAKLREASRSHVTEIREYMGGRFSDEELEALGRLLERLPVDPPDSLECGVGEKTSQRAHTNFFRALYGPVRVARLPLAPSTERE